MGGGVASVGYIAVLFLGCGPVVFLTCDQHNRRKKEKEGKGEKKESNGASFFSEACKSDEKQPGVAKGESVNKVITTILGTEYTPRNATTSQRPGPGTDPPRR